jgi:hypothetical protein
MTFSASCETVVKFMYDLFERNDALKKNGIKLKPMPGQPKNDTVLYFSVPDYNHVAVGFSLGCRENSVFDPARMSIYFYGFVRDHKDEKVMPSAIGMSVLGKSVKSPEEFIKFVEAGIVKSARTVVNEFSKEKCSICGSTQRNNSCVNTKCRNSALYDPNVQNMPKPIPVPSVNPQIAVAEPASDKQKKFIRDMKNFLILNEDMKYNIPENEIENICKADAIELLEAMTVYRAAFIDRHGKENVKYPQSPDPLTPKQKKLLKQMITFLKNIGDKQYNISHNEIEGMSIGVARNLISQMLPYYQQKLNENPKKPSFIDAVSSPPIPGGHPYYAAQTAAKQAGRKQAPAKLPTPKLDLTDIFKKNDDDEGF